MQNVAPSIALVRRSRQLLLWGFVTAAAGALIGIIGLGLFVVDFAVQDNPGFNVYHVFRTVLLFLGGIVALTGIALGIRALTWKTDNDLAKMTGDYLARHLDERFTFIRNISKLGLGYIDAVLVGPPGLLVFRIRNDPGVFFNDHGKWLKRTMKAGREEWLPAGMNPTKDAADDIHSLRRFLARHSLNTFPVFGVVVFTTDERTTQIGREEPVMPVANLGQLYEMIEDNYLAKERVSPEEVTAVANLLYHAE